jgi:hypothetical protein
MPNDPRAHGTFPVSKTMLIHPPLERMSKIANLLNKDVGALATKVLKADVGDIVRGAGRALNTDVGTIAKGAKDVLTYDLGDLFVEGEQQPAVDRETLADAPANTKPVEPAAATPTPATTAAFKPVPKASADTNAGTAVEASKPASSALPELPKARLTEALVTRGTRAAPEGTSLTVLLPVNVGPYERSRATAMGEIASDPVAVTYSGNGEAVSVICTSCWDADEAREFLTRGKIKLENNRGSDAHGWVAGIDSRGVVFTWVRGNYFYEITSPRGVSPIARFLEVFPY